MDTAHFELDPGDRVFLCSDGLYRYIGKRELGLSLAGEVDEQTVSDLVERANERGGRDNITAVVCVFEPDHAREEVAPTAERMEVLRRADLFQYCTYRELMAVCEVATQRSVVAGDSLFREGDPGRECFIIVEGGVSIEKSGQVLADLGPSDTFGIMSFLDEPRRSADAIASAPTTLLVLHRDRFLQLIRQDSDLAAKIMWQLLMKLSALLRSTSALAVAETVTIDLLEPEPSLM